MGRTKTEEFTATENELAKLAKALGHPARIAILLLLLHKTSCICGDIVGNLPLSQSTVSQHLKELCDVGLIRGEIDGPRTCYSIETENWQKAAMLFSSLFEQLPKAGTNLCI